jgi:hypothetical protein
LKTKTIGKQTVEILAGHPIAQTLIPGNAVLAGRPMHDSGMAGAADRIAAR